MALYRTLGKGNPVLQHVRQNRYDQSVKKEICE